MKENRQLLHIVLKVVLSGYYSFRMIALLKPR